MNRRWAARVAFATATVWIVQPSAVLGQTVRKVKDINPAVVPAEGRSPANLVAIGDALYFAASDDVAGTELWRAAGAAATRLKDIAPGAASSGPSDFVNVGPTVFFSASTVDVFGQARRGLWKTDGTEFGTVLVKALDEVSSLTVVGETLFFAATDPEVPNQGTELWKSDGTPDGTTLIRDIFPGSDSSRPEWLADVSGTLFFSATGLDDASRVNRELWKSDGTEEGTVVVADIAPDGDSSNPSWLTPIGTVVYFAASNPLSGEELWRSDGTSDGTDMVADLAPGSSSPRQLTDVNGMLYFSATNPFSGRQLYQSDGTGFETRQVTAINPGPGGSEPSEIVSFDDAVYFVAYTPAKKLFGIFPYLGPGAIEIEGVNNPASLAVMGDHLYFLDEGPFFKRRLRRIPGGPFPAPETPDSATYGEARLLTTAQGTLYFRASDGLEARLWSSDGVNPALPVAATTTDGASASSFPAGGVDVQGTVFLAATEEATGRELWKTDGTNGGTLLVKDINPFGSSSPTSLARFQNAVFFAADDGVHGRELWKSDGTEAGTMLVKEINPDPQVPGPRELVVVGPTLFFIAQEFGRDDLWKSDGTEAGTIAVLSFFSSGLSQLTTAGNALYFVKSEDWGHALYRTDGTPEGTISLRDFAAKPESLTVAGDLLFFTAPDPTNRRVLWSSDGTPEGTRSLHHAGDDPLDLVAGSDSVSGDSVYYSAVTSEAGRELWRAGSGFEFMVADLVPGPDSSNPRPWRVLDQVVYFSAGTELWQYAPTSSVPSLVATFKASPSTPLGPHLAPLTAAGGRLYFTADDGSSGLEVWQTDGTPWGTELLADIDPGPGSSDPTGPVVTSSGVLFQAQATSPGDFFPSGRELWALDLPTLAIGDVTVSEAEMIAEFTVTLSAPSSREVTVEYSTVDGSALGDWGSAPPFDYVSDTRFLSFPPGAQIATFSIFINNDDEIEPDETFFVDLRNAVGAPIGRSRATGTIANDDTVVPTLTVPPTAEEGDTVPVEVTNGPGNPRDWVGLYRSGGDREYLDWKYLNGSRTAPAAGLTEATVSFALFGSGPYEFRLFRNNTYDRLAVASLEANSTVAVLEAQPGSVFGGEQVDAVLSNGSGNLTDWIGLYRQEQLVDWKYLNGSRTAPSTPIRDASVPFTMPFTVGEYQFRFFKSNGTFAFLSADVSVLPPSSGPPDITVNTVDAVTGQLVQVTIAFGPGHVQDWVGLYPAGAPDRGLLDWKYLSGTRTPPTGGLTDATLTFRMPATPGVYEFRFFHANTYGLLGASGPVTVRAPGPVVTPVVSLDTTTAVPRQIVQVTVTDGPGNRTDWLGLFAAGSPNTTYRDWKYLNGQRTAPTQGLSTAVVGFPMPNTPGTYELRLFLANGYTVLATSASITVQ